MKLQKSGANPQSNSFFQSSNITINIIEQDSIEVLSMEGDEDNFVESGRPKSAQDSAGNDWHVSVEKEGRVFRELEPSELDKMKVRLFTKVFILGLLNFKVCLI